MAAEADNLVLRLLREIRGKLDEHDRKFDAIEGRFETIEGRFQAIDRRFDQLQQHVDQRFEAMDERFDELRDIVTHSFGLTSMHDVQLREHKARLRLSETWRQQTDASIARLEQRVGKLEDKST